MYYYYEPFIKKTDTTDTEDEEMPNKEQKEIGISYNYI